tara:strand:- start:850 stop:1143 length:294 start_codon:yes stop_codon:yes gene_type:complete
MTVLEKDNGGGIWFGVFFHGTLQDSLGTDLIKVPSSPTHSFKERVNPVLVAKDGIAVQAFAFLRGHEHTDRLTGVVVALTDASGLLYGFNFLNEVLA